MSSTTVTRVQPRYAPSLAAVDGTAPAGIRALDFDASADWGSERTVSATDSAPSGSSAGVACSLASWLVLAYYGNTGSYNFDVAVYVYIADADAWTPLYNTAGSAVAFSGVTGNRSFAPIDIRGYDRVAVVVTENSGTSVNERIKVC
jgi:hypothetical protein